MATPDERKAFESWDRRHYDIDPETYFIHQDHYVDHAIQCRWECWQARAHLAPTELQAEPEPIATLAQRLMSVGCEAGVARAVIAAAQEAQPLPEVTAEAYIADMIDRGPEPLRRLADWLSRVLDEDDWKTAERMLLGMYEDAAVPK